MNRFVFVSLLLLGWAYWELSGGADFTPEARPAVAALPDSAPETVTRAETGQMTDLPLPADADVITLPDTALALPDTAPAADVAADAEPLPPPPPPVAEPAPQVDPAATPVADLRVVIGSRVNLREGPGRDFAAIDQLPEGTVTEVIEAGSDGWVRIQVQGSDLSGWMAADFLLPLNG